MGIWDRLTGAETEREREAREAAEAAKARAEAKAKRLQEQLKKERSAHAKTQDALDDERGQKFTSRQRSAPEDPRIVNERRYREAGGFDSRPTR